MSDRVTFRVCSKAALFSSDFRRVLAIDLRPWGLQYGMPGGHLESGEEPDDAIRRELKEELDFTKPITLHRCDFFFHKPENKIVLGYVGVIEPGDIDTAFDSGEGKPIWLAVDDIASGRVEIGNYRDFILRSRKAIGTLEN